MLRAAIVSKDGAYRYRLDRWWGDGPRVAWIMLNPSTADAEVDDPTIRRCIAFARLWGYDGLTVVNLSPFRTPDPRVLARRSADAHAAEVQRRNATEVDRAMTEAPLVIAGWGAQCGGLDASLRREFVAQHHDRLHHLGLTKHGEPRHPLYVPGDRVPVPWERLLVQE